MARFEPKKVAHIDRNHWHKSNRFIQTLTDKPKTIFTAKELTTLFNVSSKTTRKDLQHLVRLGLMQEININQRQIGYIKTDNFDNRLREVRGN